MNNESFSLEGNNKIRINLSSLPNEEITETQVPRLPENISNLKHRKDEEGITQLERMADEDLLFENRLIDAPLRDLNEVQFQKLFFNSQTEGLDFYPDSSLNFPCLQPPVSVSLIYLYRK